MKIVEFKALAFTKHINLQGKNNYLNMLNTKRQ